MNFARIAMDLRPYLSDTLKNLYKQLFDASEARDLAHIGAVLKTIREVETLDNNDYPQATIRSVQTELKTLKPDNTIKIAVLVILCIELLRFGWLIGGVLS